MQTGLEIYTSRCSSLSNYGDRDSGASTKAIMQTGLEIYTLTTETGTPEPCLTTETGTPEPCLTTETGTPEPLEQSASLLSQVSPTAIMADCLFPTGRTNK